MISDTLRQPLCAAVFLMRCAVIINRGSGTVLHAWNEAMSEGFQTALIENGWTPEIHVVEGADICRVTRDALNSGVGAVMAGGGDGTTRAVAAEMIGSSIPLGVLPLGTLNLAARDLGSPLDPIEAVRALRPGETRRIDVLRANNELSLCMLVLGFYPLIVQQQEEYHGRRWWLKTWRFARAMWRSYFQMPRLHITLTKEDGATQLIKTRFFAIIPGEYEDVLGLVPKRANLASGRCTIYTSRHRSRASVVLAALRYLLGRARTDPELDIASAREVALEIRGTRAVPAAIDGEILRLNVPITIELLPRALTVLRPVVGGRGAEREPAVVSHA
jgi:diacylglycerol kinase family enzyme